MDSDLVGPAGPRRQCDPGATAPARRALPLRDGRLAVDRVDNLTRSVVEIDPDREVDGTGVVRDLAVEPGDVALLDLANREQALELTVRLGILRGEQNARRVEIEPVHDGGIGVASAQSGSDRIAQASAASRDG